MVEGITELHLKYPTKTFEKLQRSKNKSGMGWEQYIQWCIENKELVVG